MSDWTPKGALYIGGLLLLAIILLASPALFILLAIIAVGGFVIYSIFK